MRRVALFVLAMTVLLSIAAVAGDDKDRPGFSPGAASSYPNHQSMDKITLAAVPYVTEDQAKQAFGKVNPAQHGVTPVLLILENNTGKALRLDLRAELVDPGNRHLEATPASDVIYLDTNIKRPKLPGQSPYPNPFPKKQKKGPLNTWEIEGRAFAPKMLPAGESANGFFYFQTELIPGSHLYLTGIKDAGTGKDYFYFEVPLETPK
ncbi:MAG: hypothetical protein LAO79_18735 [Acidobacteriia bacterium]|nr:hypothetical protein [Terriglobia bacterium]